MTDQPATDHTDDRPTSDQPPTTPEWLTLGEAAAALGITVNAVRQRIKRGTLAGEKVDDAWRVAVSLEEGDQPTTASQPTGRPATNHRPTTPDPPVDLAPLADLIENLTRRNADLSATAAMWQTRAAHLEDQLKQLTAGGDNHQEAVASPESVASPEHGSTVEGDADRGSESVWNRIRKWFR